jgi:hypothetical protein
MTAYLSIADSTYGGARNTLDGTGFDWAKVKEVGTVWRNVDCSTGVEDERASICGDFGTGRQVNGLGCESIWTDLRSMTEMRASYLKASDSEISLYYSLGMELVCSVDKAESAVKSAKRIASLEAALIMYALPDLSHLTPPFLLSLLPFSLLRSALAFAFAANTSSFLSSIAPPGWKQVSVMCSLQRQFEQILLDFVHFS